MRRDHRQGPPASPDAGAAGASLLSWSPLLVLSLPPASAEEPPPPPAPTGHDRPRVGDLGGASLGAANVAGGGGGGCPERRGCRRGLVRSASRSGDPPKAVYNTRLSVSFLLEVVNRKALAPRVNSAAGERLQRAAVVDEDIYASLQGVSAALETGFAPVAWERFVFSGLTAVSQARRVCSQKLGKLGRDGREQRPLDRFTLLDLFPASAPYVSSVAWLEDATVDALRAFAGFRPFSSFSSLLDKNDEELVSFVWQADKTNFPAVDGVLFYLCTGCEARPGPRRGQLVVVFLQVKNKENVTVKDVIDSARTASEFFKAAADDPSWTSRCAFVVLSCQQQTLHQNVDLGATDLPVLVVDEAGLQATFGPGLHALIRSSAIAFGTQVIDLTRAEFSEWQS